MVGRRGRDPAPAVVRIPPRAARADPGPVPDPAARLPHRRDRLRGLTASEGSSGPLAAGLPSRPAARGALLSGTCPTRSAARHLARAGQRAGRRASVSPPPPRPGHGLRRDAGRATPAVTPRNAVPRGRQVLLVRNDCTGVSCTLPVTGAAAVARMSTTAASTAAPRRAGRVADLTEASFVALGGSSTRAASRDHHDRR